MWYRQLILTPNCDHLFLMLCIPQILPHLQANKSAGPSFKDPGKRQETPRSEVKDVSLSQEGQED